VGIVVDKVALGQGFLRVLPFSLVIILSPLLHTHLSPPHEVCGSPDHAAHYHTVCPKLGSSSLTWHLGEIEERSIIIFMILTTSSHDFNTKLGGVKLGNQKFGIPFDHHAY
jgi:hypothetical protein